MTPRYLLDTDHISLIQRRHPQVTARLIALPAVEVAVTIVSADEQLQGRLTIIRRAKTQIDAARGYERLYETIQFYQGLPVVLYDARAAAQFDDLRCQGMRIGTQDLRIAAIALAYRLTVVTRNLRDFGQVPGLLTEDWSQTIAL